MRLKRPSRAVVVVVVLTVAVVCTLVYEQYVYSQKSVIVLATTTSTYDSGLLDYLMPVFRGRYSVEVRVFSVGTGQAIEVAKRGDADLVLVHSRQLELDFVDSGYGIHRVGVMYNDYLIIGPEGDPARITGLASAAEAFRRMASAGSQVNASFVSRADKSGTNTLELSIWTQLGLKPSNRTQAWYVEAGAGMGTVLRMTNEKGAYTLTDRATWLSYRNQLSSTVVLMEGDPVLLNPYAVILVNPERYPQRNYGGALTLAKYLISTDGQKQIASYTRDGETLFRPIAHDLESAKNLGFPNQESELAWYDAQR